MSTYRQSSGQERFDGFPVAVGQRLPHTEDDFTGGRIGSHPVNLRPPVGLSSVDVGEAVLAGQVGRRHRTWFHRARSSSAAMAATPRPTKRGDSESANAGGAIGSPPPRSGSSALRQLASATPQLSSIISERSQPGVTATAVAPYGAQLVSVCEGEPVHRGLGQVVEHREPEVLVVVSRVPSVTSTSSPPGRRSSSGSRQCEVIRWVSMPAEVCAARRRGRAPRSACSTSAAAPLSTSAPQMSLTRMSMRAVVAADPVRQRAHLVRLEMVDLDGDAVPAEFVDQRRGLLDGFGSVVVGSLPPDASCDPCTPRSRPLRRARRRCHGPRRASLRPPRPPARAEPRRPVSSPLPSVSARNRSVWPSSAFGEYSRR